MVSMFNELVSPAHFLVYSSLLAYNTIVAYTSIVAFTTLVVAYTPIVAYTAAIVAYTAVVVAYTAVVAKVLWWRHYFCSLSHPPSFHFHSSEMWTLLG